MDLLDHVLIKELTEVEPKPDGCTLPLHEDANELYPLDVSPPEFEGLNTPRTTGYVGTTPHSSRSRS